MIVQGRRDEIMMLQKMLQKMLQEVDTKPKTVAILCIILATSQLLTGCGLLAQKEEPRLAPVLKSYEAENYNMVYVDRGDIILSEKIYCTYSQLNEEALSFSLTGKTIEEVFYSTGDSVKKGDLLAELEFGNIDNEIGNLEYTTGKSKLLLSQIQELIDLEITKQQIISTGSHLTNEDSKKAISSIKKPYESSTQSYQDSLYIEEMKLTALREKKKIYRIYAGMDGTLSYVKGDLAGSQSKKDEVIFNIIDSTSGAFRAESEYALSFKKGDEVTVYTNKSSYEAIAAPSKEDKKVIYFQLVTPDLELEIGDKGNVQLTLEEQTDILFLPGTSVQKMDHSNYVYYLDETGVQNIKLVKTGLEGDGKVEIISGLEYGEAVIKK